MDIQIFVCSCYKNAMNFNCKYLTILSKVYKTFKYLLDIFVIFYKSQLLQNLPSSLKNLYRFKCFDFINKIQWLVLNFLNIF